MEKGSALITATFIVKTVQNHVKLSDEEITKVLSDNQFTGMIRIVSRM